MIRYRHNHTAVVLTAEGKQECPTNIVTGNTIPALRRNEGPLLLPFGGFIDESFVDATTDQFVKLVGVAACCDEEETWTDVPDGHYVIGVHRNGRYFVLLRGGAPSTRPIKGE
jgi:hypothetical protein